MANGTWVKAVDPTPAEIQKLVDWGIDLDYINYSLDFDEMPRMERDDDYTFILIRIPHSQPESDTPFITIPLGIMIKGNTIVGIEDGKKDLGEGTFTIKHTKDGNQLLVYQPQVDQWQDHVRLFRLAAELHEVRVFWRVVVELVQHARGLEAVGAEEDLGREVGFANFER
jgi:hypothetical protein